MKIKLTESERKLIHKAIMQEFFVDDVMTAVEQILNARVKPVNEDRIKEVMMNTKFGDNYYNKCAHAIAVEFAVPACDHEPLDVVNTAVLAERERIMAKLPKDNDGYLIDYEIGYNQCLTEVKKIIKEGL